MRKIIFRGYAKTVGTDFAEAQLYPDGTPDSVIDNDCWQAAIDNAQMYGWDFVDYDFEPEDDENGEDTWDQYCTADDIGSYWEEYNGEEHDGYRGGGGSFEEDFAFQAERM
jgi:hypothetical protein